MVQEKPCSIRNRVVSNRDISREQCISLQLSRSHNGHNTNPFQDITLAFFKFNKDVGVLDLCPGQFFKLNPTNKPTNLLMFMSMSKETLKLTEDQPTNPETLFSPTSKKKGLFISPGPRTRTRIKTTKTQKSPYKGKGRGKNFQRDADSKPYRRDQRYWQPDSRQRHSRTSLVFPKPSRSNRGKISKVLEGVARSWRRSLGGVPIKEGYNLEFHRKPPSTSQPKFNLNRSTQKFKRCGQRCSGKSSQYQHSRLLQQNLSGSKTSNRS